eukprot:CAMPEP_0206170948 /NCGR_PEP_ID=MMETSP1474-20131121/40712_1 /ASSEMBLY_ACC=CAM_ASM_001110 /TAXON_ID=97495 /ORGANISM="Imantonia sp., Strain RCC918" /LENGTH=330 /DNA_ID=CAMNT_0053578035 /DNA_START=108 /DNA_END=1096 /DNA_ORIENTATION=+
MGMRKNESNSLEPCPGYLATQIKEMPEIKVDEVPKIDIIEYEPIIDSSDMNSSDWTRIVKDIEKNYFDYHGFVIIMGTDTMGYAASAFSFMLEHLGKTVVVTGSMIPFCEVFTDARRNFLVSVLVAANSDIPEVCIFFNNVLLRGNRTSKISSTCLDAFDSPNFPPLATLGVTLNIDSHLIRRPPKHSFKAFTNMGPVPPVIKLTPGCALEFILNHLAESDLPENRSLVLEFFGTGNLPSRKQSFLEALERVTKSGKIVVAASQCMKGCVELDAYSVAAHLKKIGVVSVNDMTTAAATTKLSYLIGKGLNNDEVRHWMEADICGELTIDT